MAARNERRLLIVVNGMMVLVVLVALVRLFSKDVERHAIDFHSYWYAGHFLWQGDDPYTARFTDIEPRLPVTYWDGVTVTEGEIAQYGWKATPANTAPLLLLMAPLSRLSWPRAASVWIFINLSAALMVAWGITRLFQVRLTSLRGLLLVLVLLALTATRETIEFGQTTLVVLAFMLSAMAVGAQRQALSGTLLGIALSKYSLTFPGFIYFLLRGWRRGTLVSIAVQVAALLAIAMGTGTPPHAILIAYVRILALHINMPGMHLSAGLLRGLGAARAAVYVVGILSIIGLVWRWYHHLDHQLQRPTRLAADYWLFVIIMLSNLLVFYHRRYDYAATVVFVAPIVFLSNWTDGHTLSRTARTMLANTVALFLAIWILPIYALIGTQWYVWLFNLSGISALVVALLLLRWLIATEPVDTEQLCVSSHGQPQ